MKASQILAIPAALFLSLHSLPAAVLISNFEPADGYVANATVIGVDGWQSNSMPGDILTATPGGYTFVIAGTQSAYRSAVGNGSSIKLFSSASATANDMYELSWLQASPDSLASTVEHGLWLSDNVTSTPNVPGPVAIYGYNATGSPTTTASTIRVRGWNTVIDTAVPYLSGGGGAPNLAQIYRFTMQFDWTNFEMSAFYEDVTVDPGNRIFLTTVPFDPSVLPSAAVTASDFGVYLQSTGGYFGVDDIVLTAVPEPGVAALMSLGLAGLLVVRLRRAGLRSRVAASAR